LNLPVDDTTTALLSGKSNENTSAPVVEALAPVVEAPAPVVEAPAPVVEAPAVVVETTAAADARPSQDFLQQVLNSNLATFSHSDLRRKLYNLQDGAVGTVNWTDSNSQFTFSSEDGATSLKISQVALHFGTKPATYQPTTNDIASDDWAASPDVKFNGSLTTASMSYSLNNLYSYFRPNSTVRLVPSKGDVGLFRSTVNGVEYQSADPNAATESSFTDLFPWMRVGKFECNITQEGNARLSLNFNAHQDQTGSHVLSMDLTSGCMDQEYTKNAIKTDGKPRHLCLVQFGDLFVGCAKANLPEEYRDQELKMANAAGATDSHGFARVFDESKLPFYRWHPFFGYRGNNEAFTVKTWVNMLLFNPRVRQSAQPVADVATPENGKATLANSKKWVYCSCASGENYYIDDPSGDACDFNRNLEVCVGGSVRCLNYGGEAAHKFFNETDNAQWPGNAFDQVVCANNTYNYNRLQVDNLKLSYGFGVIEKFFCTANSTEELCAANNFSGDQNILTYLLTDSVEALDINNRMRIVHNLSSGKNGTNTYHEVAAHTNALNQTFSNYQTTALNNTTEKQNQKKQLYVSNKALFNTNIEKYKQAVKDMREAENIEDYNSAYGRWGEVESHFKQKGCAPPVPPKPPAVLTKPKIEDKCHRAYKLGWTIGKDLALLITEAGDSYGELLKQMHCVKEYVSQVEAGKEQDIKSLCLDKGRKEASRLIWGLSRHPNLLKKYLDKSKKFDHWKLTYNMGYENYLKDILNLGNAPTDHVDLDK
jgi:hypothetical protein